MHERLEFRNEKLLINSKNVVYYKEQIGDAVYAAAEKGNDTVVLVGESDLDFIVEHFCFKYGLEFKRGKAEQGAVKEETAATADGRFIVYSERELPPDGNTAFYLRNIVG